MNLADITAKWAGLDPQREALVDTTTGERLTFGALHDKSTRLANAWLGAGVAKGDRVAVLAKNSIDYFIVYFACARAGFIAQPLNWRLGAEEMQRILEDGAPSVLVSAPEFRELANTLREQVGIPWRRM